MSSKAEIIIHSSEIDYVFESMYSVIMTKVWRYQAEVSGWNMDSMIEQNINISKYKPLKCSSCTELSKKLNNSRKGLINIQNGDDNENLKWCLVKYLKSANHHLTKIRKMT